MEKPIIFIHQSPASRRNYLLNKLKKGVYLLVIASLTVSCYWDSEEYMYPELASGCDTTAAVTYTGSIVPLLESYCLSCHNSGSAANLGGNIVLDTYASVKISATNGQLLGSVKHASGYSQMPKGSTKLSDYQIARIEKWINDGIINN